MNRRKMGLELYFRFQKRILPLTADLMLDSGLLFTLIKKSFLINIGRNMSAMVAETSLALLCCHLNFLNPD
jgi:hypothetical protein